MNFCSDNVAGASPEILAAIAKANEGTAMPYGDDPLTEGLESRFAEIFEAPVTVFPVTVGSAANALALSALVPPYGAIYCHTEAHINVDECGAPEFYTGGAKLVGLPGEQGKLRAEDLAAALDRAGVGVVHHVQPVAVSLTQATEAGTVYSPNEIERIAAVAHQQQLRVHMDGARFANAVASLGCRPADLTWRAGVDVLSFGATKNGAIAAEAVVFFDRSLATGFEFRRKRAGHLCSKMRFLAAQLDAYLTDDLWLHNADRANHMATRLTAGLTAVPGIELVHPVEANEIFATFPEAIATALERDGFQFYRWSSDPQLVVRLVTAFDTEEAAVDTLVAAAQRHALAGVKGI
jgi:threonine aldolase